MRVHYEGDTPACLGGSSFSALCVVYDTLVTGHTGITVIIVVVIVNAVIIIGIIVMFPPVSLYT